MCSSDLKYDSVVVDLLPERLRRERIYPAGRLDRESEGLLILTNDGSFAQSILHPSKGVTKEYEVLLNIEINERQTERWRNGFEIQGRHVRPIALSTLDREPRGRWSELIYALQLKTADLCNVNRVFISAQHFFDNRRTDVSSNSDIFLNSLKYFSD